MFVCVLSDPARSAATHADTAMHGKTGKKGPTTLPGCRSRTQACSGGCGNSCGHKMRLDDS